MECAKCGSMLFCLHCLTCHNCGYSWKPEISEEEYDIKWSTVYEMGDTIRHWPLVRGIEAEDKIFKLKDKLNEKDEKMKTALKYKDQGLKAITKMRDDFIIKLDNKEKELDNAKEWIKMICPKRRNVHPPKQCEECSADTCPIKGDLK